jgi:hypothetical protein
MTTLRDMLASEQTTIAEIGAWLDAAAPDARLAAVFELGRNGQSELYRRAESGAPVTLEHFVPPQVASLAAVHHRGKNSLPLPGKLRLFEKRFCRPATSGERLFGYNHSPLKGLVGPGYFVAESARAKPAWSARGAVVFDYFQVPDVAVPADWPRVVDNSRGLGRLVYGGLRDFMRRVSAHVSIGADYKGETAIGQYFVLVRQD